MIDKLYGKEVVEDAKPKFVKAKVGDTIKIVKALPSHMPDVKNGYIQNNKSNWHMLKMAKIIFGDDREVYYYSQVYQIHH